MERDRDARPRAVAHCLHQPERRLLDPPGTTCSGACRSTSTSATRPTRSASSSSSLDKIEPLDARLALSGHGRPFTDVAGHITANRRFVAEE